MRNISIALFVLSTACAPVYIAPAAHAPLFSAEGQAAVAAQFGTNGVDSQAALAVTDVLMVTATTSYWDGEADEGSNRNRHTYGDIGVGAYKNFGVGRIEALVGGGGGASRGEGVLAFTDTLVRAEGSYLRVYGQGILAMQTQVLDLGFSLRTAYVAYRYSDTGGRGSINKANVFAEPTAFVRLGGGAVKAELQMGLVIPLIKELDPPEFVPIHFSLGLQLQTESFWALLAGS